ncbi:MAG TPA: polysaccharide deacetylase family protein [Pseudolabrys sp.]|nr:polysaccharide deacetylase family protein [Pseudolabrys sp.]
MSDFDTISTGARIRRLDDGFRWPGGRKVAVIFNIAFERWSDGKAPPLGPMGNPLPAGTFDTNALSWGRYGSVRGADRLLRVLARAGIRSSVMTSGAFAESAPQLVRRIAEEGHEIVAHAYAQDVIPAKLTSDEVRFDIEKTTQALAAAAGVPIRGWISPRGTPHVDSARHLLAAGYDWHGDVFDDDRPYMQDFANGSLVAIPLTMEVNDLPHAMRYGRSPRQFVELFEDTLAAALAGNEPLVVDVTAHCHCYGHSAGAHAYETIAGKAKACDGVWVARRDEVAAHVRATMPVVG